jgi:imidazolonepropionase
MPVLPADLLIVDADVVTCAGPAPRAGEAQRDLGRRPRAAIAAAGERILWVGPSAEWRAHVATGPATTVIDARGRTLLPGFVDPHTHVLYAGDRRDELRRRLAGATYAEIAAAGGGIVATVQATRAAGVDRLVQETLPRLRDMLACGTTTCEVKSGYGLATQAEIDMLRAVRRLAALQPVDLVPTFLGAHEIPVEYRGRRRAYVDLVVREMIPAVAAEGLAAWCDVFCEDGVFTPAESREILEAGLAHGLKPRIHADELGPSGGSLVAAAVRARSADHLVFVPPEGVAAMREAGVVATLLPLAAFYLKLGRYAPARAFIEAGVPVALATDRNPGGGFSPSMAAAVAVACFAMNLTLEEAVVAATINAAYALDVHDRAGSLEPGKLMDAVLLRGDLTELIAVDAPIIDLVVKRGRIVAGAGAPVA